MSRKRGAEDCGQVAPEPFDCGRGSETRRLVQPRQGVARIARRREIARGRVRGAAGERQGQRGDGGASAYLSSSIPLPIASIVAASIFAIDVSPERDA